LQKSNRRPPARRPEGSPLAGCNARPSTEIVYTRSITLKNDKLLNKLEEILEFKRKMHLKKKMGDKK
jgi:hypothetical protein